MMVDEGEEEQDNELLMIFIDGANELLEISDDFRSLDPQPGCQRFF